MSVGASHSGVPRIYILYLFSGAEWRERLARLFFRLARETEKVQYTVDIMKTESTGRVTPAPAWATPCELLA